MCGIAGVWWRSEPTSAHARIEATFSALARRGPDDRGSDVHRAGGALTALIHTRLAIIDLSSAGRQPRSSVDGKLSIVFNGEIYNYIELRDELRAVGVRFSTDTDTEVLLEAWRHWGAAVLPRLEGMFAFAVFDRERESITLVRDAFGIKPMYLFRSADTVAFASELPALSALLGGHTPLDWQTAYDYLVFGDYDTGERTFIDGVSSLRAGHLLEISLRAPLSAQPRAWFRPSVEPREPIGFTDAAQLFREKFLASVRLHLRSDVPVGAAISGGLDSSAIVCAMRHLEPDAEIKTFSYIARGSEVSEESWVDMVNAHVGARPHKVMLQPGDLRRDLEDLIRAQGEPFGSTSIYAQYRVFQMARESDVTVTLDGQGADELLGGYIGYPGQRMRSLIECGLPMEAIGFLRQWARWPGRSLADGAKRAVGAWTGGGVHDLLTALNGTSLSPPWIRADVLRAAGVQLRHPRQSVPDSRRGRRMMSFLADSLVRRGLPSLLRHGDRNSMRFSVESRVPFLLPQLADFTLSLPEDYLVSPGGETKRLLRAALRGIVPDAVLDRRDKIGFATPERDWIMEMQDTVREWLAPDLGLPFLDQVAMRREFEDVVSGRRPYSWQVWRWVNFCLWYRNLR